MKDFFATTDDEWRDFFEVNVMSGVRLSRACLAGMLKRGWGRVVFISSESALNVPPDSLPYSATKTAQLAVSRGLAELTRGTAVTVNAVIPGPTLSDNAEAFLGDVARQQGKSLEEVAAAFIRERWPTSLLQHRPKHRVAACSRQPCRCGFSAYLCKERIAKHRIIERCIGINVLEKPLKRHVSPFFRGLKQHLLEF